MKAYTVFFTIILFFISIKNNAQTSNESTIYIQLKKVDSLLFERGFNNCDFQILEPIIADDFEFYHDENGIQNREQFLKGFKESICSNPNKKPIRKIIDESLEVFKLKTKGEIYGAIQNGIHLFYIKEPNKELYLTNIAKFTSTWILKEGNWKLSRVISYDHKEPNKNYGQKFDANFPVPLFDNNSQISKLLRQHEIPSISIGYIENGTIKQLRAFGIQKNAIPVSINSIYKVASLTKPVAALVALKLINNGDLDLDEPISKYYTDPDIVKHKYLSKLSTRHILSHQSGFPNWRYLTKSNKLFFEFEPGTKFQYSGEGFEYLRKVIENKLEKPFELIAKEILFTPLKMNNTYFSWNAEIDENNYAVEHDENGKPITLQKYYNTNAAANLLTTANDYSKFILHIIDGAGLSNKLYAEFLAPQVNQKNGIDRGLGMQLLTNLPNNETALMHTGGDYGTKTIVIVFPNSKKGLVLFSNSENGMVLWKKIITEYFGETGKEIIRRNLE